MNDVARAQALVAGALASGFAPPDPITPSQWAARHLIVPDGPRKLERWDASLTPYIAEPLDLLGPDAAENEMCVMKSAQTGFTTLLLAAVGHTIDADPADMMLVQPTDGALSDFNSKKLQLALEKTPSLAAKVAPQTARSGKASTTYEKKFGDYSLTLAIASSSADLRSKSVKKALLDEIDEYPDDLDGQGSPFDMIEARQESFLKEGTWKRANISTPTIKGGSHIERKYAASDKRRWHVACPHCRKADGSASEFVFEFGPHFVFERAHPFRAHYVAPCCGAIIEEFERTALVRAGRWIATDPAPGRIAGFHFDALSSPFVPWSVIARRSVEAETDPTKQKTFANLTLGLPFELRGDAPDHKRLMERREEGLTRGHIPPRGLLLVASADVQMRGIWLEILAIAPNRESWVVEALYLDGDTADMTGPAFEALKRETLDREFPDAFGRHHRIDALAVDSGFRAHVVYSWVRRHQRIHPDTGRDIILAVKGLEGWGRPAIGQPKLVDIDLDGQKVRQGAKIWGIGSWPLKGAIYSDLRLEGIRSGATADPPGYCHFGMWLDETYFRQLTAETLTDIHVRGRMTSRRWVARGDNHFFDARVYNMALAEYLGLSSTTADEWAALARRRGLPPDLTRIDLFSPEPAPPPPAPAEAAPAPAAPPPPIEGGWIAARPDWLNR